VEFGDAANDGSFLLFGDHVGALTLLVDGEPSDPQRIIGCHSNSLKPGATRKLVIVVADEGKGMGASRWNVDTCEEKVSEDGVDVVDEGGGLTSGCDRGFFFPLFGTVMGKEGE
jgi:hypothetical protein